MSDESTDLKVDVVADDEVITNVPLDEALQEKIEEEENKQAQALIDAEGD
jgi:hypothetical protein